MKKNYLFFLLLLLFQSALYRAQNITVNPGEMPNSVVACGDPGNFKFNIFGPLAQGTVITTTLPAGIKFKSLISGDVTATATTTGATFKLNNELTSASSILTVTYAVDTPCTTVTENTITYKTGSITKTVDFPQIQYSLLEVTSVTPNSNTINVFASQDFAFKIKQSAATYSKNVKVLITHSTNVSLSTAVGTLTLGIPTSGSQTDIIEFSGSDIASFGNGNNQLDQNEELSGIVKAKLLGCTSGETLSFRAAYGCGSFSSCTTGNVTSVGLNATPVSDPNLTMTQTKKPWPGFLKADYSSAVYELKNNGNGPAYNVKVKLGFSRNGINPEVRDYLNFFDFSVNGVLMSENNDIAQFNFTSDPDGPGGLQDLDGDGFFDDLPAGATVIMNAKLEQTLNTMNEQCRAGYYNGAGTSGVDTVRWRLIYTNSCNADKSITENSDNLGTNTPYTLGIIAQTSDISAPNGNVNFNATNNSFSAIYNFGNNNTSISSGAGFMTNGSGAFWRVKAILPAGISINTSSAITYSDNRFTVTYNSAISNPSTQTYYFDLKPSATNQGNANLNIYNRLTLPLVVDPSCNSNGVYNIKFSSALYRDANNVYIPELGCTTTPNFSLGCGTLTALSIENFDLKRQTFGYINAAGTQLATESNINGIELNNYLNGDKAVAAYQLKIVDPTIKEAKLLFEYDKFNWFRKGEANGGIKNIEGTYTNPINGVVTPFTIPASSIDNYSTYTDSYTGSDGKLKSGYEFNVMKLFQAGGPLSSIIPQANATINYNVNLVVNQNLQTENTNNSTDTNNGYAVTGISTSPIITLANNNVITGNLKSDKAIAFSYFVANSITAPTTLNLIQCQDYTYELLYNFSRNSKHGDLFPSEYRYNAKISKLEMLLPKGLTFTAGSAKIKIPNDTGTTINDPVVTYGFNLDGTPNANGLYDKYVFTNPGNWPQVNATTNFDLVGIRFNYSTNNLYRDYIAQQTNGQVKSWYYATGGNFSLNFDQPRTITANSFALDSNVSSRLLNYQISSAAANPTTAMNTASWPLTVNNQNTSTIPNFWIAVESPNNNIVPTLWDGATQIPMVTYGAGKFWAKVGNIAPGSKTFTLKSNDFTICGTDNFKVKTSFECFGYPSNPESGFTNQGNRALWTQDIMMSLTTQNPSLTINSSVNSTGTESFTMCGVVNESLTVTNGANGFTYSIVPSITLPTGMQFVAGSFKVNYNNVDYNITDPTLVSGTTYNVNIYSNTSLPFLVSGLPGTSDNVNPQSFVLKYQLNPLCYATGSGSYISGSRLNYVINAKSGCQTALPLINGQTVIKSQPINIGGAPVSKLYINSMVTLESVNTIGNHQINDTEEMSVKIINQGDTSGSLETIKVFVDPHYDYVPSSYTIQSGNTFSAMPTINEPTSAISASGKRVIEWTLPAGMTSGQVINFNFKVKVANTTNVSCANISDATMNTYIGASALCPINGQTCNLEYPTGVEKTVELKSYTPSITAAINSSNFTGAGANTNYSFAYTINNTNTVYEVKSQLKISLYNDTNNNGIVDAGEALLDTKYTTLAIAPSSNITETINGTYTGSALNVIAVFGSNPTISDVCTPVVLSVKSYCYKPATTIGTKLETKHGITALSRAGADNDNWPMVRTGAWTALEAKTKGFVINRLTVAQISAIPAANLVEGMMVYDTTNKCLKLYTSVNGGTTLEWKCLTSQTCPE